MPTDVKTVEVYAGDTVDWPVYVFKQDENTPYDLAALGWTNWKAQWRRTVTSNTFIDLDVDAIDANTGMIRIQASAIASRAMGGPGIWDLQATCDGQVKTWLTGKTDYHLDVTRV